MSERQRRPQRYTHNAPARAPDVTPLVPGRPQNVRQLAASNIYRRESFDEPAVDPSAASTFEAVEGRCERPPMGFMSLPVSPEEAEPELAPVATPNEASVVPDGVVPRPGTLAASNIYRRESFNDSVDVAEGSGGFELSE